MFPNFREQRLTLRIVVRARTPRDTAVCPRCGPVLRELQYLLATWLGLCPLCHQLAQT